MEEKKKDGPVPTAIASGLALNGLVSLRNTEGQLRWMSAQFGIFLNMSGWTAVGLKFVDSETTQSERVLVAVGCFTFFFANIILYEIQKRDTSLMNYWNRSLARLEKANSIQGDVKIFTHPDHIRISRSRNRMSRRLKTLSIASIIIWGLFAITSIFILIYYYIGGVK